MKWKGFREERFATAEELWERLSPARAPRRQSELIFRGQASAAWELVPIVLREPSRPAHGPNTAARQIVHELGLLKWFCEFCDQTGVRIPGDSIEFRSRALSLNNQEAFLRDVAKWPNPDLLELMALAQHHGLPTRLLDWSRHAYSAVYFAAASAVRGYSTWKADDCLAVWILNIETISIYRDRIQVVKPPGSVTPHLAAQSGLFTVHAQHGHSEAPLVVTGLEGEFTIPGDTPLVKLIAPTAQSIRLYEFCRTVGITGASLLPGASGAALAAIDSMYAEDAGKWLLERPTFQAEQTQAIGRSSE